MKTGKPFEVVVTTERGLNIILVSRRETSIRSYSHFMRADEAAQFADTLEAVLANGTYTDLECCPFCGQPFTRKDRLCLVANDQAAHMKCFQKLARQGLASYEDCIRYDYEPLPKGLPVFDYSSLDETGQKRRFRYAVQTVSKAVIHLYTTDFISAHKRHICLSYDECIELIHSIREKLDCIRRAIVGTCSFCRRTIYLDQTRYELADGRLIHRICMERFIQSEDSMAAAFPVKKIELTDVFGHAWLFRKHHDPDPFPFE